MKKKEISEAIKTIREDPKVRKEFLHLLVNALDLRENPFHPLVFVNGSPKIGKNVYVGLFSEINAKGAEVAIGDNCDIASFVSINVADSHKKCIGLKKEDERKPITIENNTFVGSHSFVKGGAHIGHHSVVAAGTIVEGVEIPPYSLIYGNPMKVKKNCYKHADVET
jgi:acetyltransferase-like isoleucine patch superfamily enzyme